MADTLNYFDVERGLGIEELVNIIPVSGAPGASGDSTTVPKGSLALDYNTAPASLYVKHTAGSGTDKWVKIANVDDVGNISWREPVVAHDDSTATIPTGITWPATIDGYTAVNIGDRVLFSAISGGDGPNVYIATGTSPNGTYVEAANDESAGDRVYVINGTDHAGEDWAYNAAGNWVLVNKTSDVNELGFIRQFIGKSAAGDLSASEPDYTSTNHIDDLDDLVTAISKLDAQLGAELVGGNIFAPGDSLAQALEKIDDALAVSVVSGKTLAVSGAQTLNSVNTDEIAWCEWDVRAQDGGNVRAWVITVTHDGTTVADATDSDREVHSRLKIGTLAASIQPQTLTGAAPTVLNLNVTSTGTVDWHWTRRVIPF